MPTTTELQRDLFDGEPLPAAHDPTATSVCVGGCGREETLTQMFHEPDRGYVCRRCHDDQYVTCSDCSAVVRLNRHRESSGIVGGPDGLVRCRACHESVYQVCAQCGRTTSRTDDDCHTHPIDNTPVCNRCWHDYWFTCVVCEEIHERRDSMCSDSDELLCGECFEEIYVVCGQCHTAIIRGEHSGWAGDPFCERCFGRAETWKTQPWSGEPGTFDKIGSKRRFGVELETCDCGGYTHLHGKTEWGCVHECSTPGKEFVSPILRGDNGFAAIRDFCDIADEKGWDVNSSCGLHIHLDISEDSSEECLRIAYAYRKTYTLWKKFVTSNRGDNSMCGSPQYTCDDIRASEHIEDFAESRDRFEFVNWRAYLRHGSFEVRLYGGSLNAREICNWVAIHARFMDAVKSMTYDELDEKLGGNIRRHWPALCEMLDDTDLLDYWRRKAGNRGTELAKCWEDADQGDVDDVDDVDADELIDIAWPRVIAGQSGAVRQAYPESVCPPDEPLEDEVYVTGGCQCPRCQTARREREAAQRTREVARQDGPNWFDPTSGRLSVSREFRNYMQGENARNDLVDDADAAGPASGPRTSPVGDPVEVPTAGRPYGDAAPGPGPWNSEQYVLRRAAQDAAWPRAMADRPDNYR